MNKHQFRIYCERVLVPTLDRLIKDRFRDIAEILEILARELVRINKVHDRLLRKRGRERKS